MKRVAIKDIKSGMITAERIVDIKHNVLLEANAEVRENHINILRTWNIDFIRVREDSDTDETLVEALRKDKEKEKEELIAGLGINEENVRSILSGSGDKFLYSGDYDNQISGTAVKITSLLNNKSLDSYIDILKEVDKAFDGDSREMDLFLRDCNELIGQIGKFVLGTTAVIGYCLYPYKVDVNPFAAHTLRTTVIAGKLAQLLKYSHKDILIVMMGALLHDIGCALLPDEIRKGKRKFTDEEQALYKKHVLTGVNLIKNQRYLPREVLFIVGSHHEKLDGSGYPLGLTAEKLPNMVRLVSLVNQIDVAINPFDPDVDGLRLPALIEALPHWTMQYDPHMCEVLIKYLESFLLSNRVTLDDGRIAEIIWSHKAYKEPVVRTSDGDIIDLNKIMDLNIDSYTI